MVYVYACEAEDFSPFGLGRRKESDIAKDMIFKDIGFRV